LVIAGLATLLALAGIALGAWLYRGAFAVAGERDPLERALPAVFSVLNRKFYVDELYAATVGRLVRWLMNARQWFDRNVLDRAVRGIGRLALFLGQVNFIVDDTALNDGADALAGGTLASGDNVRRIQTGRIQDYLGLMFGLVVVIAVIYLYVLKP
jgi:NADH-quinone oxidoreductase subunit L